MTVVRQGFCYLKLPLAMRNYQASNCLMKLSPGRWFCLQFIALSIASTSYLQAESVRPPDAVYPIEKVTDENAMREVFSMLLNQGQVKKVSRLKANGQPAKAYETTPVSFLDSPAGPVMVTRSIPMDAHKLDDGFYKIYFLKKLTSGYKVKGSPHILKASNYYGRFSDWSIGYAFSKDPVLRFINYSTGTGCSDQEMVLAAITRTGVHASTVLIQSSGVVTDPQSLKSISTRYSNQLIPTNSNSGFDLLVHKVVSSQAAGNPSVEISNTTFVKHFDYRNGVFKSTDSSAELNAC
jgi:hypothetical protein